MSHQNTSPSRGFSILDVITVIALVAAVSIFGFDRWSARRGRAAAEQSASAMGPQRGAVVNGTVVVRGDGKRDTIFGAADRTVRLVYAFRTDCPACAKQKSEWLALADSARKRGIQVTAVTSEGMEPYVSSYFPESRIGVVQVANPAKWASEAGISAVPTTMLVGADGKVVSANTGVMSPSAVDSLRGALDRVAGGSER